MTYAVSQRIPWRGQQVYYVGKNGNDVNNNGLSAIKPFLTISRAITVATAETPAANNRFTIVIEDAGIYTESFTLPSWVSLYAPDVKIEGEIVLSDDCNAVVGEVEFAGGVCVGKVAGTGVSTFEGQVVRATGAGAGVFNAATLSTLFYNCKETYCETGFCVGDIIAASGRTYINCERLVITGAGKAIARTGAGILIGRVGDIMESGAGVGAGTGIDLDGGEMDLVINHLDANTAYDLANATVLRLLTDSITGAEVLAGTGVAHVTIAGHIGNSADDIHTNFPLKVAPAGADVALIEDSAAAWTKSRTPLSAIISGGLTDNEKVVYVGKHGVVAPANNGKTLNSPWSTFTAAAAYVVTQAPAIGDTWAIVCLDGGQYAESFTVPTYTTLLAPNIVLNGDLTLTDNSVAHIREIRPAAAIAVTKTGTGRAQLHFGKIICTAGLNGISISNGSLSIFGNEITLENTYGVGAFSDYVSEIFINRIVVNTDGSGLYISGGDGDLRGSINTIEGSSTGTGIFVAGTASISVRDLDFPSGTAYEIADGFLLNLCVAQIVGAEINAGTLNITQYGYIGRTGGDFETKFSQKAIPEADDEIILQDGGTHNKFWATLESIDDFNSNMVQVLTRYNSQNWGSIEPRSSTAPNGDGIWGSVTVTKSASSIAKDAYGVYFQVLGNTSARLETGAYVNMHAMEINSMARTRFRLTDETALGRFFLGFTSIWGAGAVTVDDPAGTRAGLSFLGNSLNLFFTSKNNGGAEQRTDTGIASSTDVLELLVELQGWATQTVLFSLFNAAGTLIASATHTNVGGVPSGGNGMQYYIGYELNAANGGVGFDFYGAGGGNRYRV